MVITRLAVVIVASVPQRVRLSQGGVAGYLGYVAPSVVVIVCNYGAIFIGYCDYIVLYILYVVIFFAIIGETESVAVVIPQSKTCQEYCRNFLKLGIIPAVAFCPQKAMLAGIIHLNFCNNIFAEKHIIGSSEPAIIFSNVRMDCSTKTSEFKQKEAALTFTLSSS